METIIITSETEIKKWVREIFCEELARSVQLALPSLYVHETPIVVLFACLRG